MRQKAILFTAIFLITLSGCTKSVKENNGKNGTDIPSDLPMVRYNLPTFYLTNESSSGHMGSITLVLEYRRNDRLTGEINDKISIINNTVDALLKKKKYSDLDSIEDYEALKKEIHSEIEVILETGKIHRIIISNISLE